MGSAGTDTGTDIAVDQNGDVYVSGRFTGTVDFDPGIAVSTLTSAGSRDIVVMKLDASGNAVFARRMGGAGDDESWELALESSGDIFAVGSFTGTADFDPGFGVANLVSNGSNDGFLGRLTPDMRYTLGAGLSGDVKLSRKGDWVERAFNGTGTAGQYVVQE